MKKTTLVTIIYCMLLLPALAQTSFQHPWQGKRVAYFGDSVTDPNVKTGPNNLHYWNFLQQWLNVTPYVYAVNGRQWDDIPRQTDQLFKEHKQDFDAISIFIGTNDFNSGLPIGEWYEETDEKVKAATGEAQKLVTRKMRKPIMDNSTYRGRINIALSKLKKMFPNKQIVLLTPIHRGFASFGDYNVQPSEVYQNKSGIYLEEYIKSVKEAGDIWAVPVVDIASLSGLFPQYDEYHGYYKSHETDQLHPNEAGHKRIAQTLMYQWLTIPCQF